MDNQENNNNNKVSLFTKTDNILTKINNILIAISLIILLLGLLGVVPAPNNETNVGAVQKTPLLCIELDLESESIKFTGILNTSDDIIGCKIFHNKKIKSFDDFKEISYDDLSLLKQYVSSKTESVKFELTYLHEAWSEFLGIRRYYTILQLEPYGTEDTILVTIPFNEKSYNAITKKDVMIIVDIK